MTALPGYIVFTADEIAAATERLAGELGARLGGDEWLLLCVLNGGAVFASDLMRRLDVPLQFDTVRVARYRNESGGTLAWHARPLEPLAGRNVLLVDDIFDVGETLSALHAWVESEGAAQALSCVLLEKDVTHRGTVTPDFVGMTCPDAYVFGYGMDLRGLHRNLDHIRALGPA